MRWTSLYVNFDRFCAELRSRDLSVLPEHLRAAVESLLESGSPSRANNYLLEYTVLRVAPREGISERLLSLRMELAVLLTDEPPDPKIPPDERDPEVQREIGLTLISTIQRLRTKRHRLGIIRNTICFLALLFTVFVVYAVLRRVGLCGGMDPPRPALSAAGTAVVAGTLGGLISALSRLYGVRWRADVLYRTESALALGAGLLLNLFVSTVEGAVFALVLYAVFASGIVPSELFPKFEPDTTKPPSGFDSLVKWTLSDIAVAKMLVWGFIAGFCERFVPDLLTQFQTRVPRAPSQAAK